MSQDVYRQLLEVMKKRGGRWSGMDIPEFYRMVEELFTPEEAEVNNALPKGPTTAKDLAVLMGRDEAEIEKILESMANKGLLYLTDTGGRWGTGGGRFNLRDHLPQEVTIHYNAPIPTAGMLALIRKGEVPLYLNVHPQRWADGPLDGLYCRAFDMAANAAKILVRALRSR